MDNNTAVSDTGPLLHLSEIGQEKQLSSVFKKLYISEHVADELKRLNVFEKTAQILNACLCVDKVSQSEIDTQRKAFSEFKVHTADLSVAALAARLLPDVVINR